ncbi:uroporphyrinogen-III synthase [Marinagarivorans cellulosilyticus]|uniref:uroporphyrinogen-III synthase n=1 Tax=Marinagarivorans cellulosilyticus TaxID=2721545 RepID=UPI001F01C20F|nr:uroporphyrinogen-III synthase [Marinagarivorans cellulosilyticus]
MAFTSPSSAQAFARLAPHSRYPQLYKMATFAAIGAATQARCNTLNIRCEITPEQSTVHSLAREIAAYYAKKQWLPNHDTAPTIAFQ